MMVSTNFHLLSSIFMLHAAATSAALQASDARRDLRTGWTQEEDSWNYWWSYSGVSGPAYWGLLNSDWYMCDRGRRQSPIDVTTRALVYDPNLTPLRADNNLISGILYNDGHSIVFNGSLAARASFASLERRWLHKTRAEAEAATAEAATPSGAGEPTTSSNTTSGKSRRAAAAASNDHSAHQQRAEGEFVLVADANDSLLDVNEEVLRRQSGAGTPQHDYDKLTVEQQQWQGSQLLSASAPPPPMLMRELSNSIELSMGESDRLDAGASQLAEKHALGAAEQNQLGDENSDQLTSGGAAESSALAASANVHFSGGPGAYSYKFESLQLKFSQSAGGGSEHHINGRAFVAELQVLAYNWQLYKSYDEASTRPHGLLAISVLIDHDHDAAVAAADHHLLQSTTTAASNGAPAVTQNVTQGRPGAAHNEQLERLVSLAAGSTNYRGHYAPIQDLNLSALLPDMEQFVTYEGSLTQPGCHESVTWLILNRPLYISRHSLDKLRLVSADEQLAQNPTGTLIAGNSRPVQPINNRPVRTNIRPAASSYANLKKSANCKI